MINFLIKNLCYFRDFRRENLKVLNNICHRLRDFFDNPKQDKKSSENFTSLFIKFIKLLMLLLRQVLSLPHYIIQTINLRRSQCEKITLCEAFVIASNRLDLDSSESIISQLEHITQEIGGSNVLNLFSGHSPQQKTKAVLLVQIRLLTSLQILQTYRCFLRQNLLGTLLKQQE